MRLRHKRGARWGSRAMALLLATAIFAGNLLTGFAQEDPATETGAYTGASAGVEAPPSDPAAEELAALEEAIAALPAPDQLTSDSERQVYDRLMALVERLEALPEAQRDKLSQPAQQKLDELCDHFAAQTEPLAVNGVIGTPNSATYVQNAMDDVTLVGPYQFNIAGNSNTQGKYNNANNFAVSLHGDTAGENAAGYALPNAVGGKLAANNKNSSTAVLEKRGENTKVVKAYLLVCATQTSDSINSKASFLSQYGMCLKGPKGTINRYYPSKVYCDNGNTRTSCYFDVTDFVKAQGYGTYAGINIPYTNMTAGTWGTGTDLFGAWKLIVVEEDPALPLRMMKLKLGGESVVNGATTTVTIQGNGLVIKGGGKVKPSGELLVSMDGYDIGDSSQTLRYYTDKDGTQKKISQPPLRGADYFFSAQISKLGKALTTNPGPAYAYALNSQSYLSVAQVNGGSPFTLYNTDFSTMKINDSQNAGGMNLQGGEKTVSMLANTSSAPTLLSALGLAVDIVVPEFTTDLTVTNLTQHYATSDAGYDPHSDYAQPGDRLRANIVCGNTSTSSKNIGIKNAVLTVEVPAFVDVDAGTISAYYVTPTGGKTALTGSVSGNKVVFKNSAGTSVVSGGQFEVSFEGTARGSRTYTAYANKAWIEGTFVDDSGNHYPSFLIDNMGIAYAETASDILRFPVSFTKDGEGTVGGAGCYPYDGSAQLTWQPAADHYTRLLLIDGQVRDDLVLGGGHSLPIDSRAHEAFAAFTVGERPVKDNYLVATAGDSHVTLTPSSIVEAGADHTVSWSAEAGYSVSEVLVDGYAYPVSDSGSIAFKGVAADHTVEVRTVSQYAYVQTIVRGPGEITPSVSVRKGEDHTVRWNATGSGILSQITVNGITVYDEHTSADAPPVERLFADIQQNQIVEVIYREPDAVPLDQLLLNTQILGGPGSITPSKVVNPSDSATVEWTPGSGHTVQKVLCYRGPIVTQLPVSDNRVTLTNITEDCMVQVFLQRDDAPAADELYRIETALTGGPGSITHSQLDIQRGEERTITWSANPGYLVTAVVVDGETRDDLLRAGSFTFADIDRDHYLFVQVQAEGTPTEDEAFYRVDTASVGGGSVSASARVEPGADHTITWRAADGESVLRVTVDGIERPDLVAAGQVSFTDIAQNHRVSVVFTQGAVEPPAPEDSLWVRTDLYGGPGTITGSSAVESGDSYPVAWTAAAGYRVKTVLVDGRAMDALLDQGGYTFADIAEDHHIVVILEAQPADEEKDRTLFTIYTEIVGEGEITPTATLSRGADHQVNWSAAAGWVVDRVYVDGVEQTDAVAQSGQMDFTTIAGDHRVKVVLRRDGEAAPDPADSLYRVETAITGGIGTITPTTHYAAGADAQVEWVVDARYTVARVYVDGQLRGDLSGRDKVAFLQLEGNHRVEVVLIPLRPAEREIVKAAANLTHPDGPNTVGDRVQYTLTARNKTAHSQWDNVVLSDRLPASLTIDLDSVGLVGPDGTPCSDADQRVAFDEATNTLTVQAGTLLAEQTFTVTFVATVNEKAVSPTGGVSIRNMALVQGTDADGEPVEDVWSEGVTPGDEETVLPLAPAPYIEKTAQRLTGEGEVLYVGDAVGYRIAVGNRKAGSLWADVRVRDRLPAGLTPDLDTLCVVGPDGVRRAPADYSYDEKAHTLTVCLGDLYGGEEYVVEFEATLNEKALTEGIGNTATAVGYPPDDRPEEPPAAGDRWPEGGGAIGVDTLDPVYPDGYTENSEVARRDSGEDTANTGDERRWGALLLCLGALGGVVTLQWRRERTRG